MRTTCKSLLTISAATLGASAISTMTLATEPAQTYRYDGGPAVSGETHTAFLLAQVMPVDDDQERRSDTAMEKRRSDSDKVLKKSERKEYKKQEKEKLRHSREQRKSGDAAGPDYSEVIDQDGYDGDLNAQQRAEYDEKKLAQDQRKQEREALRNDGRTERDQMKQKRHAMREEGRAQRDQLQQERDAQRNDGRAESQGAAGRSEEMLQRRDERKEIMQEYRDDQAESENASATDKPQKKPWWKFWDN